MSDPKFLVVENDGVTTLIIDDDTKPYLTEVRITEIPRGNAVVE
jgi:hypothetical protein